MKLQHTLQARTLRLRAEAMTRLRGRTRLRVLRGMLWLTVDGEPDDHLLLPGDRFTLHRGARALVQALKRPASVEVTDEASRSLHERATAALTLAQQRFAGALW